jgi:hypothetical protein
MALPWISVHRAQAAVQTFPDWESWPAGQPVGGYIFVVINNDGGGTALTISDPHASDPELGWVELAAPQVASGTMRSAIWYRKVVSQIPAPEIAGANDEWAGFAILFDGLDPTNPIEVIASNDYPTTVGSLVCPAVTTATNGCHLLRILCTDTNGGGFPTTAQFGEYLLPAYVGHIDSGLLHRVVSLCAYEYQDAAGVAPDFAFRPAIVINGRSYTIALKPASGALPPPRPKKLYDAVKLHPIPTDFSSVANLTTLTTSIGGLPVEATGTRTAVLLAQTGSVYDPPSGSGAYRLAIRSQQVISGPAGIYGGVAYLATQLDLSAGVVGVVAYSAIGFQRPADRTFYGFVDGSGEWVIFQPFNRADATVTRFWVFNPATYAPVAQSAGAFDWSDVAGLIGAKYATIGAAAARTHDVTFGTILALQPGQPPAALVGAGLGLDTLKALFHSFACGDTALVQAGVQAVAKISAQVGNAVDPTVLVGLGLSLAYPNSTGQPGYLVSDNDVALVVKPSAFDYIDFSAATILSSGPRVSFIFSEDGNPAGLAGSAGVLLGLAPELDDDGVYAGALLAGCNKILAGSAQTIACQVRGSVSTTAAIQMTNGGSVENCIFIAGSEPYAIEVPGNGPQTIDLSGASFSGYTKPINILGTTGTITISIGEDDDADDFAYDTAGATVVFDQPVTLATARVDWTETGSRVQVYNETTSTEIYNDAPAAIFWEQSFLPPTLASVGDTIRVRVRKAGFTPIEQLLTVNAAGFGLNAPQVVSPHWGDSPDLDYTVDFVNKKLRATGTRAVFMAQEIADYLRRAGATEDGIRQSAMAALSGLTELEPGVVTALTVELLNDWQVSWAASSVTQARITGGNVVGGIAGDVVEDVVGGPQVQVLLSVASTQVAGGGSGPSATDIATAVWAHVSRTLTASLDPSAITIAAAVRSELSTELARVDVATSTRASDTQVATVQDTVDGHTPLIALIPGI